MTMKYSLQHILKRREWLAHIERRDMDRRNYGSERRHRYQVLWLELHRRRRLANAKLQTP
jgi:hypothetical protein